MANLKFISTGSTTVTLSGNGLSNSFTANGSAYTLGTAISLADGEYVQFAGSTNDFSKDGSHYYQFSIGGTGTVTVEGDLISLINNNAYVKQYQFVNLFKDCSKITSIANLNFPASIADFCYSNMFAHCTGLVNGGTTLPATSVSRWCYNGMFIDCSSMTTPPTILATKVAPFSYYQMFAGCTSLTNGPQLFNTVVEGRMNSNCMFKDCSNLSTIHVSFTTWPAEADQSQSRNWLNGVSNTGLFVYPTTLASIPTGVVPVGWTLSATYPATIVVADQTYSFDALSNTNQTKIFGFSYVGGTETLNIAVDTANMPSWLTYTTDSDSVDFSANGYAIDSSTTVQIPITFSASDAATKNVVATFNITNYPTNTITISTIPSISFDFNTETLSSVNLLQYVTYTGTASNLSTEIVESLPEGVVYENGVLSANKDLMTNDISETLTLRAYASDARIKESSFLYEVEGVYVDYSAMPLTIECITDEPISVSHDNTYAKYSKNGGIWYNNDSSFITLNKNETIAFSGTSMSREGDLNNRPLFAISGNGRCKIYGNLQSLQNFNTTLQQVYRGLFRGNYQYGGYNYKQIVDLSNLTLGATNMNSKSFAYNESFNYLYNLSSCPQFVATQIYYTTYNGTFAYCSSLISAGPFPAATGDNASYNNIFDNCTSLRYIEWGDDSLGSLTYNKWAPTGIFVRPYNKTTIKSLSYWGNGWTVLARGSDNLLYRVDSQGNPTGNPVTVDMNGNIINS